MQQALEIPCGKASTTPRCVRCGTSSTIAEWSETVGNGQTTHVWRCPACDCEFETIDNVVEPRVQEDKLIEQFLPSLLVA